MLSARVPKDWIYPVLVIQARYVAPDISGVSKSRVNILQVFQPLDYNDVPVHVMLFLFLFKETIRFPDGSASPLPFHNGLDCAVSMVTDK